MTKTYKSYPLCEDAPTKAVRAYNRAMIMSNIMDDINDAEAECYAEQFTDKERLEIAMMIKAIMVEGHDSVFKQITKQLEELAQ